MFLRNAGRPKFDTIFGSDMRPLLAILGLLLCLIPTMTKPRLRDTRNSRTSARSESGEVSQNRLAGFDLLETLTLKTDLG